jgi:hypothetical protein
MSAQKTAQQLEIEQLNAQLEVQLAELSILQTRQRLLLLQQQTAAAAASPAIKQPDVQASDAKASVSVAVVVETQVPTAAAVVASTPASEVRSDKPWSEWTDEDFPTLQLATQPVVKKETPISTLKEFTISPSAASSTPSSPAMSRSSKIVETEEPFKVVETKKAQGSKVPACGVATCKRAEYHTHCCQLDDDEHMCKCSIPLLWDNMPTELTRSGLTTYVAVRCPKYTDKIVGHVRACNTKGCTNVAFTLNVPEWHVAKYCNKCRKAHNST